MRTRRPLAILASFLMVAVFSACSGDEGSTMATPDTQPPAGALKVIIKDFAYEPATLQAKVGDKITVTNEDSAVHTLTASDKSFDTGPLRKGQSATVTVTKAGPNPYICTPHPYMVGTIEAS